MSSWRVEEDALESIVIGAGILGTGGGGNPYVGKLRARKLLRAGHEIEVIALEDVPDEWRLCTAGGMGAPTIAVEKLPRGSETTDAVRALEEHVGHRIDAILPAEIGGGNSIEPMIIAATLGIPMVDADGMGRAFPTLPMITYFIYGVSPFPCALADEKGNQIVYPRGVDDHWLERLTRSSAVQMGGFVGCAVAYMSGADAKRTAIGGTLSWARALGDRVRRARAARDEDVLDGVLEAAGGRVLFEGKVVDVERRSTDGFARGQLVLDGFGGDAGAQLTISFQNEYLVAWRDGEVVATVPDLICMVNREDGEPITVERLRYGYRVAILGVPCSELLRTPEALDVVGPPAFGYDLPYEPMEVVR
ncbi:DUF917 domain-containing protein [Conexibacter woesei]|uniref:Hydantoinase/oxoprolinase n=1 Tax=Conexibacter woesei (strain DSM 14684 / CCUG 47730 / CIP 108061 / JCM 11494 / NBRC 100937 / ID131577) TaxID=469383 RepID=D3F598_CONWI|nr:DUF917 domain-containing protein [Conexibacter woesei]ADB50565.1 protein of unknown function DUF917 [Conexibacter woesei DSM 14684]